MYTGATKLDYFCEHIATSKRCYAVERNYKSSNIHKQVKFYVAN